MLLATLWMAMGLNGGIARMQRRWLPFPGPWLMRSSFSPQHESDGNGSFCDKNTRDGDCSGSATPRRLLLLSRTMMATAQRRQ
ncbi:hypothetical protein AAHE18_12G124500 [Arachis hypogaea]